MFDYTFESFIFDLFVIILPMVGLYYYTTQTNFYKNKCWGIKITLFIILFYVQTIQYIKRTYVFKKSDTKFDNFLTEVANYL